jgi:diaminopimelate decarboxylase
VSADPELLAAVAAEQGTPVWVYDADAIRAQVERLRMFDTIRFAQKASSNLSILRLMREWGVLVDAVSDGEIERALRAGYPARGEDDPLVLTADLLDRRTLARVVSDGITVNCGSPDMIEQLGQASPGHRVWLRVNPGFGHGHSRKTNTGGPFSKHGIWHEELDAALAIAARHDLRVVGLHMHIGSGADVDHLARVADAMVRQVLSCGLDVEAISAGGGLPVPYAVGDPEVDVDAYFPVWDGARTTLEGRLGHSVRLEIEPGRFLVAAAGSLVAEVRAVKRMGENRFVLVDAGFNDLVRPALYGSRHRVTAMTGGGAPIQGPAHNAILAGPLCESGDVFTQDAGGVVGSIPLPAVAPGDLVAFHDAGAYGASMSSTYNSRPLIPEVLSSGGATRVIRRRQEYDDLLALEAAP